MALGWSGWLAGWLVFILRLANREQIYYLASRRTYTTC
jgi:hypothetical protein